jgi:colanic acid biosynthesis glycosyl transferase WcaI
MASGEVIRQQPKYEKFHGADVHRVWTFGSSGRDSFLRRMLAYSSFMIIGGLKAMFTRGQFDAMIVISPLPNGIAGLAVSLVRKWPMMFDVCDIWPDCAVAVGMLQNPVLVRAAHWIEKKIYRRSIRVGVVTRGFTENLVAKGTPREKIVLLPDWVDPETYHSTKLSREKTRREYELNGRYVVSFMGNFGLLMGIETILETARIIRQRDPEVLFWFVGKGVALQMMNQRIREWQLDNVRVIPYQPREKVPDLLAASDALVVTYKKTDITQITVPSKIYEYMSSARPIIAGVDGVIREILEEAGCGLVSASRDPGELADFILQLKADPAKSAEMGERGRYFATRNFNFDRVAADYERAVRETAESRKR